MPFQEKQTNCFLKIENGDLGDGPPAGSRGSVGERLDFTNMPSDVGSSKAANVQPINILGRSNPLWVYGFSDERSWNLELSFFAVSPQASGEPLSDPNGEEANQQKSEASKLRGSPRRESAYDDVNEIVRQQVLDKMNWCESLVYPIYKEGLSRGLPNLLFVFGDMLSVNVICTDVQSSYPGPHYLKKHGAVGYPMYGICNLTLKQIGGRSFSHLDVRANIHNGKQING